MKIRVPSDVVNSVTDSFAQKYPTLGQGNNSEEIVQAMLETMRFLGITVLEFGSDDSIRYSFSRGFAPLLVSSKEIPTGEQGFRKVAEQLELLLKKKITILDFEILLAEQFLDLTMPEETLQTLDIIEIMDPGFDSEKLESMRARANGIKEFLAGNLEESRIHFEKALEIGTEVDDMECVAASCLGLGNVHATLGEIEKANTYHERAYISYNEIGNIKGMGRSKNNLAYTSVRLGLFREAIYTWKEAIDLLTKAGDTHNLNVAHLNMGALMTTYGYYRDGMESAMNAYQIALETGNDRIFHLARVLMTTIDVYSRKRPPVKRYIVEALNFMKSSGNRLNIPTCYEALALYHIYSGNTDLMFRALRKSLDGYKTNSDTHSLISAGITFMRISIIYKLPTKYMLEANKMVRDRILNKKDWERYRGVVSQFFPEA